MGLSHVLEDFGKQGDGTPIVLTDVAIEDQKLAAFENGYQAGWDDCAKSAAETGTQVSEDFAQNIRDLSFTYHDAYGAFLADLKPVLRQLVEAVLPQLARDTLGPKVTELIEETLSSSGPAPVVVAAAQDSHAILQAFLDGQEQDFPLELRQDPTLAPGQICLRFGDKSEQELDTAALLDGIRSAVDGFFQTSQDKLKETA